MSEEVQIELPQPLALIVEDLSSLYEFAPMEHSKIDPKYYELQGKTDGILWYVDLKEGNSKRLWCFHEKRFFTTENEVVACLEIGLGMCQNDFPFELTLTLLLEVPSGDSSIEQMDTITIESPQHWSWVMEEYVQSYIDDAKEILVPRDQDNDAYINMMEEFFARGNDAEDATL